MRNVRIKVITDQATFGALWENIGLLFILSSGHTEYKFQDGSTGLWEEAHVLKVVGSHPNAIIGWTFVTLLCCKIVLFSWRGRK